MMMKYNIDAIPILDNGKVIKLSFEGYYREYRKFK